MSIDIDNLIKSLTLCEKAALCSGVNSWETTPIARLNIPSISVADGPHGVRKEFSKQGIGNIFTKSAPSTCFPPAVTMASTWNKDLIYDVGAAIGSECVDQNVQVILGPGVNIKRNPLCGRNFEYFSEDPYLTGIMAKEYINGVQSNGVGTSIKHFALNSQEHKRHVSDSIADERAFREIYLKAFEIAVKQSKPETVMCSYNRVAGLHASENKRLLTDILRDEWGFDGVVISDWGAVNDRILGITAGLNIEMPSSNGENDKMIVDAVESGKLSMADLDKCVKEILTFVFRLYDKAQQNKGIKADYDSHHLLAKKVAAEGSVLLKNEQGILPLKEDGKRVAVIGKLAEKMRYQGSGSSMLEPKKLVNFLDALKTDGIEYDYAEGYPIDKLSKKEKKLIKKQALQLAEGAENVLLFVGLTEDYESEAFDRTHLSIPKVQIELMKELHEKNKNIIAILSGGAPVTMEWLQYVKALLNVYLGGEAGGEATLDIIYGKINPSGRLAETYAKSLDDILSNKYFETDIVEYRESIFVGYRYFDTAKKDVLFPFGYGLSYTQFEYSDLKLSSNKINEDDKLNVSLTIKNTGKHDGAEVVQLYVKDTESSVFVAEKQLKGFEKVFVKVGEVKEINFTLDKSAFAFYNTKINDWYVEEGDFEIMIAASSRDIRLSKTVYVESEKKQIPNLKDAKCYFNIKDYNEISKEQFEIILGKKVPVYVKPKKGQYDMNTLVGELDGSWFSRLFRFAFKTASTKILPKDSPRVVRKMTRRGALDMPIRNFYLMSGGSVSKDFTEALLDALNGTNIIGVIKALKVLKAKETPKSEIYK